MAAAAKNGALGYAEASGVLGLSGTETALWQGQIVDASCLLVRYTIWGDSNLDGNVDFTDLVAIAQHYNTIDGNGSWFTGDFNYDGNVNFDDLVLLAQNYNQSLAASADSGATTAFSIEVANAFANVPEPARPQP